MTVRVLLLVSLLACKERGTVHVPVTSLAPCSEVTAVEPEAVAVYFVHDTCASVMCGLKNFHCEEPGCIASCAHAPDGYCSLAELAEGLPIEPPDDGEYAVVLSYRYPGASVDEGFACIRVKIDADGTESRQISSEGAGQCCMQP